MEEDEKLRDNVWSNSINDRMQQVVHSYHVVKHDAICDRKIKTTKDYDRKSILQRSH